MSREVLFAVTINKIEGINEIAMSFTIVFYLQLQFLIESKEDDFVPYIEWSNGDVTMLGNDWGTQIEEPTDGEGKAPSSWWGRKTIRRHMRGTFTEPLELSHFPFDYQKLHVFIRSDKVENIRFSGMHGREVGKICEELVGDSTRQSAMDLGKLWTLVHWRPMRRLGGSYVDVDFSASDPKSSGSGESYAEVTLTMYMCRLFSNYIFNIYLPAFGITALSLSQFYVHLDQGIVERETIPFALLLSLVALRFSVSSGLPKIPYATRLDLYLLFCICFIFGVAAETFLVIQFDQCKNLDTTVEYDSNHHGRLPTCPVDDTLFYVFLAVFWGVNVVVFLEIFYRSQRLSSRRWTLNCCRRNRVAIEPGLALETSGGTQACDTTSKPSSPEPPATSVTPDALQDAPLQTPAPCDPPSGAPSPLPAEQSLTAAAPSAPDMPTDDKTAGMPRIDRMDAGLADKPNAFVPTTPFQDQPHTEVADCQEDFAERKCLACGQVMSRRTGLQKNAPIEYLPGRLSDGGFTERTHTWSRKTGTYCPIFDRFVTSTDRSHARTVRQPRRLPPLAYAPIEPVASGITSTRHPALHARPSFSTSNLQQLEEIILQSSDTQVPSRIVDIRTAGYHTPNG